MVPLGVGRTLSQWMQVKVAGVVMMMLAMRVGNVAFNYYFKMLDLRAVVFYLTWLFLI